MNRDTYLLPTVDAVGCKVLENNGQPIRLICKKKSRFPSWKAVSGPTTVFGKTITRAWVKD